MQHCRGDEDVTAVTLAGDNVVTDMPLFERWRIHDVLYLSASRKMVLVISRLYSAHLLSNRRPLLFIFPAPCLPITPLHCSSFLPTLAVKSPSTQA